MGPYSRAPRDARGDPGLGAQAGDDPFPPLASPAPSGARGFRLSAEPAGGWVKHARYFWRLLAEGRLTRQRFGSMLRSIAVLPKPHG